MSRANVGKRNLSNEHLSHSLNGYAFIVYLCRLLRRLSPERVHDGPVAVLRDGDQRENGRVHGHVLEEGAEGAHEVGQVPPLQQRRLEVERDVEHPDDEVGERQVGDEEVGDGAHPPAPHHHVDHQRIACGKYETYVMYALCSSGMRERQNVSGYILPAARLTGKRIIIFLIIIRRV